MGRASRRKKSGGNGNGPASPTVGRITFGPSAPAAAIGDGSIPAGTLPQLQEVGAGRTITFRRLRVVLSYVAGGSMDEPFGFSLARLFQHEGSKRPEDRVCVGLGRNCGLYVDRNRDQGSRKFLGGPGDILLGLDTDIEFPPELPEHVSDIMGANPQMGMLAVNVPLGNNPTSGYSWDEDEGTYRPFTQLAGTPLQEVDGVATAVCAFRREVLIDVARKVNAARADQRRALREHDLVDPELHKWFSLFRPFDVFGDEDETDESDEKGIWCGEDLAFCWRAKQLGHRIFMMRYPLPLFHWKKRPLRDEFENVLGAGLDREESKTNANA